MPLGMVALTVNHHHVSPQEAEIAINVGETKGLHHLGSPHLPQIMGSRVTGAHYQWLPWCRPGLAFLMRETAPRGQSSHDHLVFKDKDAKDAVTHQSWRWDLTLYQHAGCRDHTLLPYAIRSLQGYPGKLVQSSGTNCWQSWMNPIIMWKHRMHGTRSYSNYGWQIKKLYQTVAFTFQGISRF